MVLQQALVDVTGQPFDALLQEAVLGPLQMHRSTFVSSPHAQTHTKLLWPAPFLPNSLSPICWAVQAQPLSPSLEHNAARAHPEVPGDDQAGEKCEDRGGALHVTCSTPPVLAVAVAAV